MKRKEYDENLAIAIEIYRKSLEREETIDQLCVDHGMARSTYYRIIKNNNEVFAALEEFDKGEKRLLYTKLKLAKLRAIDILCEEVTSMLLTPGARIQVIQQIERYIEEIEKELNISGEEDLAAQILRTLPPRYQGKNVLDAVSPDEKYKDEDDEEDEEDTDKDD